MSENFEPGSFIRYRVEGPRAAKRGCLGLVADQSEEGLIHGWARVGFAGSYDDYAADELEAAQYWAVFDGGHIGPFQNWDDAKDCVIEQMREGWPFELVHPLGRKRNELIERIESAEPALGGICAYWDMGICGIKLGGSQAPLEPRGRW